MKTQRSGLWKRAVGRTSRIIRAMSDGCEVHVSPPLMTDEAGTSAGPPCYGCGYDLRATPRDGKCPECGASVAESRRLAAIPRRPAWRDSDPRWRWRVLAGAWVLVLLPVVHALVASDWASDV